MRFDRNILSGIIHHFDILNTINGGVSMTSVNISVSDNQYNIIVHTPGLDKHAYHVEVVNNMILIYSIMQIERTEGMVTVPSFAKFIPIPHDGIEEEIYAIHEDGKLNVFVPIADNQSQRQNQRKIDISYR